jgi:hypothetical protein
MRTTARRSSASRMYAAGPSSPAWATGVRPIARAAANTRSNLAGGLPRSPESRPTPARWCRYGRAASSVANASSSDRWRRKHRISFEVSPQRASAVALRPDQPVDHRAHRHAARGVGLRVEEQLGVDDAIGVGPREVRDRQVVEVLGVAQHVAAGVVDVEERLQVGELVGAAQRLDRPPAEIDAVAGRLGQHHLGLERALDVQVQLDLGQRGDQALERGGQGGDHDLW